MGFLGAGHTEATIDLARLSGKEPSGVLCEILDMDGNRADRKSLQALAKKHGLEIISIEELIRYRRTKEKLVEELQRLTFHEVGRISGSRIQCAL